MTEEFLMYNEFDFLNALTMPRKKPQQPEGTFGQRLASLRKAAGLTQQELADQVGTSRRMIAHYERLVDVQVSVTLIPKLAKSLGVSTDELFGTGKTNGRKQLTEIIETRFARRFKQLQQLPLSSRRHITSVLDSFLEGQRLKQTQT